MGIGLGILLLVLGLILLFAIKEFPDSLQEVVDPTTVGWILVIAGVLALVLGLVMNNQRSKTTHVEERRDSDPGTAAQSQPRSCAIRAASLRVVAPVLPIAADRWLRTVPSERCTRAAIVGHR